MKLENGKPQSVLFFKLVTTPEWSPMIMTFKQGTS